MREVPCGLNEGSAPELVRSISGRWEARESWPCPHQLAPPGSTFFSEASLRTGRVPSLLRLFPSVQTGVDAPSSQRGWKIDEVRREEGSEELMLLDIYQKMMDVLNKQPNERWQPQVHLTCHSASLRGSLLPL